MSLSQLPQGILIAVEGIDGAGKTTQVGLLDSRLRRLGFQVTRSKEPTDGDHGRRVRAAGAGGRLTPQRELAAFTLDRRRHVRETIRPALEAGHVVILDRYYFSTAAYQGSLGYLDPAEILRRNEAFAPQPDLLLLIDTQPATALQRIADRGAGTNLFERRESLEACARIFRRLDRPGFVSIDGELDIVEIHRLAWDALLKGPLFDRLCLKRDYLDACEPEYCSFARAGSCAYPSVAWPQPRRGAQIV